MKKMVAAILAVILLGSMIGCAVAETAIIGVIVGINEKAGYIVIDDFNDPGYEWRFQGINGWHKGQRVVVVVDDDMEVIEVLQIMSEPRPHETYSSLFEVTEIDRIEHVVTITDCNGFDFQFYGDDDWEIGDMLTAIMDNNGTHKITDDEIISVRYERPDLFDTL